MVRNNRLELALYTATLANQELRESTKKLAESNDVLAKSLAADAAKKKSQPSSDPAVKAFRAATHHLSPKDRAK